MAGYYDNSSLLSGSNTPQFDVGALLKGGAAIQQSLGGIRERELEDAKVARDAKRFAREQELNTRADTEYNREIGLRSTRQDLSKEFLTNPYAAKFGSGKETALLDQQVNDYVSKGGVIDDDMAKRLQARYEEAKPFREDATNALTSQMILAGEDPTKAAQVGAALGSNLLSRVEQQAAVSANRKIEQDQYDEAAKRNKEALQLKLDISKANQAGDKDKAELLFKQFQAIGGGGTGGSGTASTGLMDTLSKIGPIDAKSALTEGGPIDLARKAGFTEAQIARAAGQSLDTDPTAWTWADNKLDTTMFSRNLGMQTPGAGLSKSINIRDIQAPTAEEWASIVPDRAGYRVVDYDPKKFLDNSKSVLPELFGKDAVVEKPLLSEAVKETTEKKSGGTLADRNNNPGNIKITKDSWQGGAEGEKGFVKFETPELGARALAKTIMNGGVGKTVEQYMNKYAPESDNNDTKSYVADVTKALGKKPDDVIKLDDVPKLMEVISKREGGTYSNETLNAGYKLAVTPQLAEFHKAVKAKDGSADVLLKQMAAKANDPTIDWSKGVSNADVIPTTASKYPLNDELTKRKGGVGGEDPEKQAITQRIDEINAKLGANPAPTPENLALMDEKLKLAPRTIGDKIGSYANTLRRELIDPLGPSGYAVGGIPKVGAGVVGKLSELLTPSTKPMIIEDAPKLLENLRPQGTPNWTGTGRIATDKLNGVNAETVLGQAGNQGNKLAGALRNADEAKRLLEETPQTKLANLNYFSNTSLNKLNLKAPVDAQRLLNGAIEARKQGQIDDAKLLEFVQKINDTKLLNTREIMEALDRIGFKR